MALATKCPHCKTTFRVASDQLKLRGGIVRCGTCNQVFDGNASLIDLDAPAAAPAPAAPVDAAWTPDPAAFADSVAPADEPSDEAAAPIPEILGEPELEFGVSARAPKAAGKHAPIDIKLDPDPDFDAKLDAAPQPEDDYISSAGDSFDALMASMDEEPPELPKRGDYVLDFDLSDPVVLPPSQDEVPALEGDNDDALPEPEPFVEAEFHAPREELPEPEPFIEAEFHTPEEPLPEPEPFIEAEFNPPPAHELVPEPEPFSESEFGPEQDDRDAADAIETSLNDESDMAFTSEHPDGSTGAPDLESGPLPLLRAAATEEPVDSPPPAAAFAARYDADLDEPEFVRLAREKELAARRRRLIMGAGSALLALALLVQGATTFRNVLVAKYPGLKPAVSAACTVLRCKIELPAQIEGITVETGELQSRSATTFRYSTVLRNDSGLVQAWPHLELALKDGAKVVVRRVFTPAQYLAAGVVPAKGFPPHSEQAMTINFELKELKASGFDIAVFYP